MEDLQEEIWKDVVGYEGYYKVSNLGSVISLDRIVINAKGHNVHYKHRKVKINARPSGYFFVSLSKNNKCRHIQLHRVVCTAFHDNIHNKPCVNHKDGNKGNNTSSNLEWCTHSENAKHAFSIGLKVPKKGECANSAKLNTEAVVEIRKRNLTRKQLAIKYGVDKTSINNIWSRKTWNHI